MAAATVECGRTMESIANILLETACISTRSINGEKKACRLLPLSIFPKNIELQIPEKTQRLCIDYIIHRGRCQENMMLYNLFSIDI